eukprot:scaffold106842_cov21-Tisochrysis_lutea.AAC.1
MSAWFRKTEPHTANGQGQRMGKDIFVLKRHKCAKHVYTQTKYVQTLPQQSCAANSPTEGLGGRTDVSASAACPLFAPVSPSTPAVMPAASVHELQENPTNAIVSIHSSCCSCLQACSLLITSVHICLHGEGGLLTLRETSKAPECVL